VAPGPGAVLAATFVASVRREGLRAPADLGLLAHERAGIDAVPLDGPGDLGPLHEALVAGAERTLRGAWYTPRWLAEDLVARALPDRAASELGPVVDPACGGGVFLLAAAERLVALGHEPGEAVARLHGIDVDPLAVAVTEAALWWWAACRDAAVRPAIRVGDGLLEPEPRRPGSVVGNPPFLGQLRADTAADAARRAALRRRFGAAVRPYTDPAWLFLLDAVERVAEGGRVVLVQPQSCLGARDGAEVRARIDGVAELEDVVVADAGTFAAAVDVCAPVLRRARAPVSNDWTAGLAAARRIPEVELTGTSTLGEMASLHAGFRDEYYGTVAAVREGGPGVRLVTSGAIDPLRLLDREQRFAGRRWRDPRVDVSALSGRAARWAEVQRGPKAVVATQTRVLEAVADPAGSLLASVPAIVVRPHDPRHLWRVLAVLTAPSASAWLLRRSAGTALSADSCRPTVGLLGALPVPDDERAWDVAAGAVRAAAEGRCPLAEAAAHAEQALGVADPAVLAWWDRRRPHRDGAPAPGRR
jgi:hypothetical protein